ncbi:uncharacterized protein LOC129940913 [Eupeodes corollae]|uniref:uncharacterized protein LOC129940913 n=1 Tax=Eupeodes corollae TaxID=290404 RepID=UPI0024922AB1|nr:uncharacterized protein LOC129940913 [Eupeodes corollae]
MNSKNFNNKSVEELLKSSKQMQNKMRKEFNLQTKESYVISKLPKPQPLSTSLDNATLKTCEDNAVVGSIQKKNKSRLSKKSNIPNEKPLRGVKIKTKPLLLDSNKKVGLNESFSSLRRSLASADKLSKKISSPLSSIAKLKTNENFNESSKISLQSKKLLATSSCRLPLQRFADPSNRNIDFFEEHPHLELDMTSKQRTLFPRRFHKSNEYIFKNDAECLNEVEAEVKPPQKTQDVVVSDTWKYILQKNKLKSKSTQTIVRLKKTKENVLNIAKPVPQIQKPEESYDVIASNPSKGFFKLQKKSQHLDEQKKFNIERFPVLYIRPECKVQKVTNISICGKTESVLGSTAGENYSSNVRYIECRHEDRVKTFEQKIIPPEIEIDAKEKDTRTEANATKNNKFFKALEFNYFNEHSATNSESSPLQRESISSRRSFSSLSSSSSSLKNVNPTSTVHKIQHRVRSPSDSPLLTRNKKNSIKKSQSRCNEVLKSRSEVYVQTENECQQSILKIASPLQNQAKSSPQSELPTSMNNIDNSLNKTAPLHKLEYPAEDDIIAKIFQRILNDLPDALDKYNNRKNFTANGTTSVSKKCSSKKEHNQEENNQEYQNPTPVHNEELDVSKLVINEKEKIEEVNLSDNYSTLGQQRKEFSQQNPSIVQNIKAIKTDTKSKNPVKQTCPKEAEIKRAVKIFLDTLTLDDNVEKNAILKDSFTENRSMTFPKLKLIGGDRPKSYINSESSSTSNSLTGMPRKVKRNKNRAVFWRNISGSSTSIGLSSTDLDLESDATDNISSISSTKTKYTSDGEIKSLGEI